MVTVYEGWVVYYGAGGLPNLSGAPGPFEAPQRTADRSPDHLCGAAGS